MESVNFSSTSSNPNHPGVKDISGEELSQKLGSVSVIDVRRPDEYTGELGHIKGAKLVTLDTLPGRLAEIPKDETVVFVCKGGSRSANATAFALENGFRDVYNLAGGMMRWNELGLEVER